MDPTLLLMIAVFGGLMWWMSRSAKKQRKTQEENRNAAIVVGATVRTIGGFFGTIVDIDGDAITLESPSGIETVWFRNAIQGVAELPLASSLYPPVAEIEAEVGDVEKPEDDQQPTGN